MTHYTIFPVYPSATLSQIDYPDQANDVDWVEDWVINALKDEMIAVQQELGTFPKGTATDLKTRLSISLKNSGTLWESAIWTPAPEYPTTSGIRGQIAYTTDYFFICYNTDTWRRTQLTTW